MRYRAFVSLVFFVGLACFSPGALAQGAWPSKPIHFVLLFAVGGSTNALSRVLSDEMRKTFGQPVIIEPRPGAGGVTAMAYVAKSAPDGYTIMLSSSGSMVVSPLMRNDLPYDTVKDFAPISRVAAIPFVIAVPGSSPFHSLGDLIAAAKAKPGSLAYAHTGVGTTFHLGMELFTNLTGIKMIPVAYKGSTLIATDLVGAQVPVGVADVVSVLSFARAGRLRILGTIANKRSAALPNVPLLSETLPGFVGLESWYGLAAPAGVPRDITARINAEVRRIMALPEMRDHLVSIGMEALTDDSPDAMAALIGQQLTAWRQVVKLTGSRIE